MARTFYAKYEGFCPECKIDIRQGEEVMYSADNKVIHVECGDDEQAVTDLKKAAKICPVYNLQQPCEHSDANSMARLNSAAGDSARRAAEAAAFAETMAAAGEWSQQHDTDPFPGVGPTPAQSATRLAKMVQGRPAPAPIPTGQDAIEAFFQESPVAYTTLEEEAEAKVKRDQWDRPLIEQPDGGRKPYSRASSFGSPLDDKTNVEKWSQRQIVRGIAIALRQRPAFLESVPERLFDPWNDQESKEKDMLNSLAEQAKDMAGSNLKSQLGTDIHYATEIIDAGDSLEDKLVGFEPWRKDLLIERANAYHRYTSELGLKWDSIEVFGVQDDLLVAGTWDRRGYVPWWPEHRQTIGDVKTSSSMDFAGLQFAVQLATYSRMCEYVIETGERIPHEDMNLKKALIVHVDRMKNGPVEAFEVDIEWGWRKAIYAREIIIARREGSSKSRDRKVQRIDDRRVTILACTTKQELRDMSDVINSWPQHLIDLAKKRWAEV